MRRGWRPDVPASDRRCRRRRRVQVMRDAQSQSAPCSTSSRTIAQSLKLGRGSSRSGARPIRRFWGRLAAKVCSKTETPNGKWGPALLPAPTSSSIPVVGLFRALRHWRARPFVSAWLDALATGGQGVSLPLSSGSSGTVRLRNRCPRRLGSASPELAAFRSPLRAFGRLFRSAVSGGCLLGVSALVAVPGHTRKLS